MPPLTPDDLLPLDEYVARRPELLASQAKYLDRYRRVRLGPRLTLVFENRQTLWFRVQEVLRVARLADPALVQAELNVYNGLLPARGTWQAALILDIDDGPEWGAELASWHDLSGDHLALVAGGETLRPRLVTCRPEDRCAGTAHWLAFTPSPAFRAALGDPRLAAHAAADYRTYRHQTPLSAGVRKSLLDDLTLAERAA